MDEGIENHLYKCAYKCYSYENSSIWQLPEDIPEANSRTLCHLLVQNTKKR